MKSHQSQHENIPTFNDITERTIIWEFPQRDNEEEHKSEQTVIIA